MPSALPTAAPAQDAKAAAGKSVRIGARPLVVQDYEPDPAIWLVRDEDTTIYLLGTVHVLPPGFRWRSERVDRIVAEADELVVESSEEDMEADAEGISAALLGSLGKRPRLSERLAPGNGAKWLAVGKALGMAPEQFDRVPPLVALFGIGLRMTQAESGADSEHGVETVLEAEFEAAGKPIHSIENPAEVLGSLLGMDEGPLIKDLNRALAAWDESSLDTLLLAFSTGTEPPQPTGSYVPLADEHAWASGQVVDIRAELFGTTAFGHAMGTLLLDNRNRAWAGWLERRLADPGTVLVAVGAGHLGGENSLQTMLSERGLAAERLD
jgi:uncharacterized protein YbaP (TraB family)